jgi:Pvc16 N-terminal domain
MIVEAITLLLVQLNEYIAQADGAGGTPNQAVSGNIAQLDRQEVATELENHIVLSLVNLEEERALKNGQNAFTISTGDVAYRNRPVHLNLFLLFTANYRNYQTALRRLAQVLTFFQGKQKFTFANSPGPNMPQSGIVDFSLLMDLLSLNFEEVNHLWGFLGTKESPFAIYRGRLVVIADQRLLETGGRIQDIEVTSRDITA